MDMPVYPGDPLTPGVGATKDAKRLPLSEADTLTKIPVLPISYGDAQPLLAALEGPRGSASLARRAAHHLSRRARPREGPPEAEVQLGHQAALRRDRAHSRRDLSRRVDHPRQPSRCLGERRGRSDLRRRPRCMEEARALGTLLKQGWKPKRTIIYCLWDGEEPGLLGSTEWAETHADGACGKRPPSTSIPTATAAAILSVDGSHTLEKFINGVARDIDDPEAKMSRLEARCKLRRIANPPTPPRTPGSAQPSRSAHRRAGLRLRLHRVPRSPGRRLARISASAAKTAAASTIPSTTISTGTRISPTPNFVYGRALAQTAGTAVLRLADAELLPFDFDNFTDTIRRYIDEVEKLAQR